MGLCALGVYSQIIRIAHAALTTRPASRTQGSKQIRLRSHRESIARKEHLIRPPALMNRSRHPDCLPCTRYEMHQRNISHYAKLSTKYGMISENNQFIRRPKMRGPASRRTPDKLIRPSDKTLHHHPR